MAVANWVHMVCNVFPMSKSHDKTLIDRLGGPAKVAVLLGLPKYGGIQRVHNWTVRGIPAAIKVQFPHLFMPELAQSLTEPAQGAINPVASEA